MTELHRRARDLIAIAGDGEGPTARQRSRLRASVLAQAGAATLVAGAAGTAVAGTKIAATAVAAVEGSPAVAGLSAAGGGAFATLAAKVAAVVALSIGIGAGGYAVASRLGPEPATSTGVVSPLADHAAAAAPVKPARAPAPVASTPIETLPSAPLATAAGPRAQPVTATHAEQGAMPGTEAPSAVAPRVPPAASVVPVETFEAETRALRGAVAMLRDGQAERALATLDAQDALYTPGALGEEREATRINALCLLGRTDEARGARRRFLDVHPRSLLAARVRASCGGASF